MLTRCRSNFKRDFRVFARFMSDKPSDNDGKAHPSKAEQKQHNDNTASKQKMQELLKLMMSESKNKVKLNSVQLSDDELKIDKIEESLTKAAGNVAEAMGGDVKQTEAELLSRVLGKINQSKTNLSDLLVGMKVDHSKDESSGVERTNTRGQQVKRMVNEIKMQKNKPTQIRPDSTRSETSRLQAERSFSKVPQATTIDVFSGSALGIFQPKQEPNYGTQLDLWNYMKHRELTLATIQPPANYFQKMILWTEQGKVWKFPINNEQGMDEEQNVHFSEHIFLDMLLEDWCPTKGPIRHFMELVCVGLSKNAFYTVQEKKDHIMWYKEYFESKKNLLSEIGVWEGVPNKQSETRA